MAEPAPPVSESEIRDCAARFVSLVVETRRARGMSQTDLARATGMTQPALSRLEAGEKGPNFRTMVRICRVLGIVSVSV